MTKDRIAADRRRTRVRARHDRERPAQPLPPPFALVPANSNVVAFESDAARAVQGLALNRAFLRVRDPVTRLRLVALVAAAADVEES